MNRWLHEIELIGEKVKLVPLRKSHSASLIEAASDGELWKLKVTSVPSKGTVESYMNFALSEQKAGRSLPFVVIDKVIGSTRFCNATSAHRRLEIGYTWYSKSFQRTGVNTECKLLLLQYAFEVLECIAVEFRTNIYNTASKNAIQRLGAQQDGILRNHRINPDGTLRDSAVYSIIDQEWEGVKKGLEYNIQKHRINK